MKHTLNIIAQNKNTTKSIPIGLISEDICNLLIFHDRSDAEIVFKSESDFNICIDVTMTYINNIVDGGFIRLYPNIPDDINTYTLIEFEWCYA